jgi:hypothetical protein
VITSSFDFTAIEERIGVLRLQDEQAAHLLPQTIELSLGKPVDVITALAPADSQHNSDRFTSGV